MRRGLRAPSARRRTTRFGVADHWLGATVTGVIIRVSSNEAAPPSWGPAGQSGPDETGSGPPTTRVAKRRAKLTEWSPKRS